MTLLWDEYNGNSNIKTYKYILSVKLEQGLEQMTRSVSKFSFILYYHMRKIEIRTDVKVVKENLSCQ